MRLLWDASGLAKRYAPEVGSATAHALWAAVPVSQMTTVFAVYAEAHAIMLRKRNGGVINEAAFLAAKALLRAEVINSLDFVILAVDTTDVLAGIDLTERHNINSSDAAFLAVCLRYAPTTGNTCVVVAADGRLVRAAIAEGLSAVNPEVLDAADVPAFLAGL